LKDVKTRWAVYDDSLRIWYNGKLVAKIDASEFKYMLKDLAEHQAYWKENETE